MVDWYPKNKEELTKILDLFLRKSNIKINKEIHGLIVPHAGYMFSGTIAGNAYSVIKDKEFKKAIILSPSHYTQIQGIYSHNNDFLETPLGKINITKNNFKKIDLSKEHAINNQLPFIQKIGIKETLPLMVGKISLKEANEIAESLLRFEGVLIVSTDLSHFLNYDDCIKKDKTTIRLIEDLDKTLIDIDNSACGIYPLMIIMELCKIKKYKPKLIIYKNSGDITGIKDSVVGYCGIVF